MATTLLGRTTISVSGGEEGGRGCRRRMSRRILLPLQSESNPPCLFPPCLKIPSLWNLWYVLSLEFLFIIYLYIRSICFVGGCNGHLMRAFLQSSFDHSLRRATWLQKCPVCLKALQQNELAPNYKLREAIAQYRIYKEETHDDYDTTTAGTSALIS